MKQFRYNVSAVIKSSFFVVSPVNKLVQLTLQEQQHIPPQCICAIALSPQTLQSLRTTKSSKSSKKVNIQFFPFKLVNLKNMYIVLDYKDEKRLTSLNFVSNLSPPPKKKNFLTETQIFHVTNPLKNSNFKFHMKF